MLTISLKAHWQVATIMLSECWLHNKQPQTRQQGIKIAKLSSTDYSFMLPKTPFVMCMGTKGGFFLPKNLLTAQESLLILAKGGSHEMR